MPLGDPAVRAELLNELYGKLRSARNATEAEPITEAIEQTWRLSGSDTVDLLMSRVDTFVLQADLDLALQVLDAVTELAPELSEGWHQRGLVHVMQNDTDQAITDLRRALAMEPNNYKALRDLGAVLQQNGDKRGALDCLPQGARHQSVHGADAARRGAALPRRRGPGHLGSALRVLDLVFADNGDAQHVGGTRRAERHAGRDDDALPGTAKPS